MSCLKTNMKVAVMGVLLVGAAGCASDQSNTGAKNPVVMQNRQSYDQQTASLVVNYDVGQVLLTQTDRNSINSLIEKSHFDASKDRIEVASWADNALPENGNSLSSNDEDVAKLRMNEIAGFLKSRYDDSDVQSFNMAERSNWLARVFSTRDAELKSRFAKEDVAPMSDKDLEAIRSNGAQSRSVIVISHK